MSHSVEDLEARMAWYEKQLAELDGVVRELFVEVGRLRHELDALREDREPEAQSGRHEPPPHY